MANQYAVVAMELLSHYAGAWQQVPLQEVDEPRRLEWAARIMTITKSMFILTLSAMEFSAKQALQARPGRIPSPKARIYLGNVMVNSEAAGLISTRDRDAWKGLIEV